MGQRLSVGESACVVRLRMSVYEFVRERERERERERQSEY
jgi:hypothetical protein